MRSTDSSLTCSRSTLRLSPKKSVVHAGELRAARRGRQFGGAGAPCRGAPGNGLALPVQFGPSRLRTTSRVILSGGGNLTTFSAGERGCSAAVFRRRRRQCAAPFVHRSGG